MKLTSKAQEALDRILKSFEEGTVPEAIAKVLLPRFDVPSNTWSLNNRLLMFLSGTADARGIRQWRNVGRWIRKGSRAMYILVPIFVPKEGEEDGVEEAGKQALMGFRCCPVFRVEDTDGDPVDFPDLEPPEPPPLYHVAQGWGLEVTYLPGNEASHGYYSPDEGRIGLCTHDPSTFFHELAHAAHHRANGAIKIGQHWRQEVTAELTAAALMHLYGERPNDGGAYMYIKEYAERAEKDVYRACMSVIADVGRCLELILSEAGERMSADEELAVAG